jgi:hypothetical protein
MGDNVTMAVYAAMHSALAQWKVRTGRCIGRTGSIDLSVMPPGMWPHKQKDRLRGGLSEIRLGIFIRLRYSPCVPPLFSLEGVNVANQCDDPTPSVGF